MSVSAVVQFFSVKTTRLGLILARVRNSANTANLDSKTHSSE
jgi:hypothetical protein